MTKLNSKDMISDAALDAVAGGLNPQPLPPHPDIFKSFLSRFVIQRFTLPAFSLFKFR